MKLELLNTVIHAEDYESLRDWYIDALELEIAEEFTATFHYAELVRDGKGVLGIASAKDENGKYTYGGFEDIEGNACWVFQPPT